MSDFCFSLLLFFFCQIKTQNETKVLFRFSIMMYGENKNRQIALLKSKTNLWMTLHLNKKISAAI